ncbi:MAG: OadG family protein [Bacteroidales bacterium]|nr:OadG family protein [Bacteroidales bacterium]MBO7283886.1 OadG family protein [Bacteroidales bacterium]MBO7322291.1 OadG family protein [Bacteroidales bacterium]
MNKLKLIWILVSLTAISVLSANAQSQSDMRLNELLVTNTSDFQDDFGQHSAWFELFNISYGTVDIGGCYLSNDPNNLKKYIIPKADVLTKIPPRQHVLFWADNQPFRGTFHVNFTLAESDTIYFVASDGRTILDKIFVPKDLEDNVSYGRSEDGIGEWEVRQWTSPSTNNSGVDAESKSSIMRKTDPHGIVITIVAMSVVFFALIILYVLFKFIGNVAIRTLQKRSDETTEKAGTTKTDVAEASAETYAAIGVALHLFKEENEAHDEESFLLTLQHTDRTYSPWSSKIYTLRQTPSVKKNQR